MNDTLTNFNHFLAHNLNDIQQEAVKHREGSLLIVAGAGSGKTRVITARIANLILNENVDPSSIVALTFTNKAAKEMQERIKTFLPEETDLPFIGTFHSYCLRILKTYSHLLDHPFISILDSDDQQKLLHGIIMRNHLNKQISAQNLSYQISHIKNHAHNPEQVLHTQLPFIKELFLAYEAEKRSSKCLDFDDLLLETLRLFKKNPLLSPTSKTTFSSVFHSSIAHILVDEYQDTNVVQHALLLAMAKNNKEMCVDSICVVGDEDQSIYSWRGATVANILNFKKDFEHTTTIKLEQNYRSVQPILELANHVIKHNKNRNPKKLWSERTASDRIRRIVCNSDYQEGEIIANFLTVAARTHKRNSVAILYRTHFQSRSLEEGLIRASIAYKILGGVQFYERKEIKDLLAYLRLIVNPFDRTSFFRVINCPTRSLGEKFEELFYERWNNEPFLTFVDVGKKLLEEGAVTGIKKSSLLSFLSLFDNSTHVPLDALNHIINGTNYFTYLKKTYSEEDAHDRIDNVKELLRAVAHFQTQQLTTIALLLDEIALMQEHATQKNNDNDPVLLMTLHAAKGLEFETVILAGLEEGLLPSSRSLTEVEKLEEERRLFYVGITRAKERLLLSHCRHRYAYGKTTDQVRSRFLEEIPQKLVLLQDLAHASTAQTKLFFSDWLNPGQPKSSAQPVLTFHTAATPTPKVPPRKTLAKPQGSLAAQPALQSPWKKNQPVQHPTFGIGIVQKVEKRDNESLFVEVKFKTGIKKIAQHFLQPL